MLIVPGGAEGEGELRISAGWLAGGGRLAEVPGKPTPLFAAAGVPPPGSRLAGERSRACGGCGVATAAGPLALTAMGCSAWGVTGRLGVLAQALSGGLPAEGACAPCQPSGG